MSTLLFDEPPLVVSPTLACKIGLQEAIFLQQIHYWAAHSKTAHEGRKWVYNTYKEWAVQFPFWKPESIRKIVASLRMAGLLDVRVLSEDKANRTNYYAINYDRLRELGSKAEDHPEESTASIRKNPPHHPEESTASLYKTETTTETTQRSASRRRAPRSDLTFAEWIETCKTSGERPVPESDSVFEYAEKAGLPLDYIVLHWKEFKASYAESSKRYKDWRAVYRKSVRGNWYRLWFFNADGVCTLTTQGQQANRIHKEQT
jgi:hypothetical protein